MFKLRLTLIISSFIVIFSIRNDRIKVNANSYPIRECIQDEEFKCFNGGICQQIDLNSTSSFKICICSPGFTGRQCEHRTMPCSPDPCAPNGYCNSFNQSLNLNELNNKGYLCRCKPGFVGENCEENVNDCLNASCFNGGSCIDGINSYECDCKWPYIGRYCQTKMKCDTDVICKNNGKCIEENGPKCICKQGYEGIDCSIKIDKCKFTQCQHGGICVPIEDEDDYKCECKEGRYGKNCQYEDYCLIKMPCKNNSTCINLLNNISETDKTNHYNQQSYYCQCLPNFTGINCDIKLKTKKFPRLDLMNETSKKQSTTEFQTATTATPLTQVEDLTSNNKNNNGSFVLIVNIPPEEFKLRQTEIIREFEKKFGILMLIKKEENTNKEMVYAFHPSKAENNSKGEQIQNKSKWTKVYFIIIFACMYDTSLQGTSSPSTTPSKSLCLQNNINNLNDATEILSELKKSSSLLPNYVSNISYEAYSANNRNKFNDPDLNNSNKTKIDSTSLATSLVVCLAIALLIGISLALTVLIRQNAKRIKAPIWFPPPNDCPINNQNIMIKNNFDTSDQKVNNVFEIMSPNNLKEYGYQQQNQQTNSWSIGKKFDELSNFFFGQASTKNTNEMLCKNANKNKPDDSPPSSLECGNKEYEINDPPLKMRKIDIPIYSTINNSSSSSSSSSSNVNTISSNDTNTTLIQNNTNSTNSGSIPSLVLLPPPPPQNQQKSPSTPEFYPSPPESLPDSSFQNNASNNNFNLLQPINYKGASYGITPLMLFIMSRSKLKNSNTSKNKQSNSDVNESEIIDTFVLNGSDLNVHNLDGETALHLAARCGLYDICERLIKNGAELNTFDNYGRNVLHTAVCSNEYDIVKLILTHCSILNENSNTSSMSNQNSSNSNNFVLDDKFDLIDSKTNDELGDTCLIIASRLNLNNLLKLLIDFNATINATDNEGRSALHWCTKVNNYDGALMLIQAGANVNMQDNDEKTPLSSCLCELNTIEVAELLIKYDSFISNEDQIKYNKMKAISDKLNNISGSNRKENEFVKKDDHQRQYMANMKSSTIQRMVNKSKNSNNHQITATSTSTKRKLSDTISSVDNQNSQKQSKLQQKSLSSNGNKLAPVYTPLTPSPPSNQNSLQQQPQKFNQTNYSNNINSSQLMFSNPNFDNYSSSNHQINYSNFYKSCENINNSYNYLQDKNQYGNFYSTNENQINRNLSTSPNDFKNQISIDLSTTNNNGNINLGYNSESSSYSNQTNLYNNYAQNQQMQNQAYPLPFQQSQQHGYMNQSTNNFVFGSTTSNICFNSESYAAYF